MVCARQIYSPVMQLLNAYTGCMYVMESPTVWNHQMKSIVLVNNINILDILDF